MKHLTEVHAQAPLSHLAVLNEDGGLGLAEQKYRDCGLDLLETKSKVQERSSYWKEMWGNEELQSWSYILRNPFEGSILQTWWTKVFRNTSWSSYGRRINRKAAWFVAKGCSCEYRYSGTIWNPNVFPEWLKEITKKVMNKVGWPDTISTLPNSCNINLYEDGKDCVQWHSDDEALFNGIREECTIISLSLGASRTFEIQRWDGQNGTIIGTTALNDGDLLTMEGMFQKYMRHRLIKDRRVHDSRINLTWRWIKKHDKETCRLSSDNPSLWQHRSDKRLMHVQREWSHWKNNQVMTDNEFEEIPFDLMEETALKEDNSKQKTKPRGIKNLKNTCYFSVIMQCLLSCNVFVTKLEKHVKEKANNDMYSVASSVCTLMRQLSKRSVSTPFNPRQAFDSICKIKLCKEYAKLKQQDAVELFEQLIDNWNVGSIAEKRLSDTFWGWTQSVVRCPNCRDRSASSGVYERWSVLSLSLGETNDENTLSALIGKHTKEENLDWNTEKCIKCGGGSEKRLTKKLTLTSTAEVLVLHLKRFEYIQQKNVSKKIIKTVIYDEHLKIANRPNPGDIEDSFQMYCLKGVVVHIGDQISNGHYEAFTKDPEKVDAWYRLNDEDVCSVGIETVLRQEAYMLFYENVKNQRCSQNELNHRESSTENRWNSICLDQIFEQTLQNLNWKLLAKQKQKDRDVQVLGGSKDDENEKTSIAEVQPNDGVGSEVRIGPEQTENSLTPARHKRPFSKANTELKESALQLSKEQAKTQVKRQKIVRGKSDIPPWKDTPEINDDSEMTVPAEENKLGILGDTHPPDKGLDPSVDPEIVNNTSNQHEANTRETTSCTKAELSEVFSSLASEWEKKWVLKAELEIWIKEITERAVTEITEKMGSLLSKSFKEVENLKHEVESLRNVIQSNREQRINVNNRSPTPVTTTSPNSLRQPSPGPHDRGRASFKAEDSDRCMQVDDDEDVEDTCMQGGKNKQVWKKSFKRGKRIQTSRPRGGEVKKDLSYKRGDHFGYLHSCFQRDVGLPLLEPQTKNICSFANILIATGYERVVCTQQGMYYQLNENDIVFKNLRQKIKTARGEKRWSCEGATVYNWDGSYEHVMQRHRFAMIASENTQVNFRDIRSNKWYVHVYQTKIEHGHNDLRTLRSREMARYLHNKWKETYWPRNIDIREKDVRERKSRPKQKRDHAKWKEDEKRDWQWKGIGRQWPIRENRGWPTRNNERPGEQWYRNERVSDSWKRRPPMDNQKVWVAPADHRRGTQWRENIERTANSRSNGDAKEAIVEAFAMVTKNMEIIQNKFLSL